jgi:hypothetical protein
LVHDPLQWHWSTHRDAVGAIVDPWVSTAAVAAALNRPLKGFAARHHAYVSADPSVNLRGTPPPRTDATTLDDCTLRDLVAAALAATRGDVDAIRHGGRARHLLVLLAKAAGFGDTKRLAKMAGCSQRTIRRLAATPGPDLLPYGLVCLVDPRLRRSVRGGTR